MNDERSAGTEEKIAGAKVTVEVKVLMGGYDLLGGWTTVNVTMWE